MRRPLQLSPVLAVTVTLPVGTLLPATLKLTVTAWLTFDGLGKCELMVVVLAA
jgi:hypothetical protein